MNTTLQKDSDRHVPMRGKLRERIMLYLVIPSVWVLLIFLNRDLYVYAFYVVCVTYLLLLCALTAITFFAEERLAGRLKQWRRLLSIGGRLAFGGLLSLIYLVLFVLIVYGPDYFQ